MVVVSAIVWHATELFAGGVILIQEVDQRQAEYNTGHGHGLRIREPTTIFLGLSFGAIP